MTKESEAYSQEELAKYSTTQQILLRPFAEDEITYRDNYQDGRPPNKSVDPEKYQRRLMEAFPKGYTFEMYEVQRGQTGLCGYAHFAAIGSDGEPYDVRTNVFVEYIVGKPMLWDEATKSLSKPNPSAGQIMNREAAEAMLDSAGLKACGRRMGVGLHTTFRAAQVLDKFGKPKNGATAGYTQQTQATVAPAATAGAPPAGTVSTDPNFDPAWDGSVGLPINVKGNKGVPYANLDDGLINWLINKTNQQTGLAQPDQGALKERARRQVKVGAVAASNVASAAPAAAAAGNPASFDDEIPF